MDPFSIARIGASIVGGLFGNRSSRRAANTQAQAATQAADAQLTATRETNDMLKGFRQEDIGRFDPFYRAGTRALGQYENALASPFQFNMEMDPGYQFRLNEGADAVASSAGARHGTNSGAAMKALTRFNQDYASNEFGNAFGRQYGMYNDRLNRLGDMAARGQNAAGMQGAASQAFGSQMGQNTMQGGAAAAQGFANAGNAQAAGIVGGANAFTGAINDGLGSWQYNRLVNAFLPQQQGGAPMTSPRPMPNPFRPMA